MNCHTILGIKESASPGEIDQAYTNKRQQLEESHRMLSSIAYAKKMHELDQARVDCNAWVTQGSVSRIRTRVHEAQRHTSDVRLYTPCCGPLTCLDSCGAACMDAPSCYDTGCSGILYIDLCLMGVAGIYGLIKWGQKHEANMRIQRRERADRAREDNVHLDAQLGTCKQEEKGCRDKIAKEQEIANKVNAFSLLFVSLGANPAAELIAEQNRRIETQNKKIADIKQREDSIRSRIRDNDRLIAEANNDN